jgi:hypothetical protein
MTDANVPNPFQCARRIPGVIVMLKPRDVIDVWHSLTVEEAEHLLERHGLTIAAQMLTAGVNIAVEIIKHEGEGS